MSLRNPEASGRPLKVAMYNVTAAARIGGVESFVWGASSALARLGHEIHIFTGRGGHLEPHPDGVRVFSYPFLPRHRIPNLGSRFRKLGERLSFAARALPDVIRERYDVLHIHKPYDLPVAVLAKRFSGVRVMLGCHGRDFFCTDRLWFRCVDAAVSCSEFNARQVQDRYGVLPAVIYNGIDPEEFRPLPADTSLREDLGFRAEEQVILYVGRLIGWKGVSHLIVALNLVVQRRSAVRLLILGDGEERRNLENLGGNLGLSEKIVFAGPVPRARLPRYLALADVFVLPSIADETFGISLCEAMACGVAAVATRVGGIPEVAEDRLTGFFTEPGDAAGMAEKILLLLADPELRGRMGREGRQRVLARFTWDRVARALENEYYNLSKSPSPHAGGRGEPACRARGAGRGEGDVRNRT
ncbi:MAG: glycosyltransferase family 4 protein [Candidatus Tectomicrobia bacterium]|uniref:Glycosyltransferase family 4 protein n=1 Tax=Tectimicrobiota bacterium TaxID=2528274 RepID=A0A932M201_UNCTE|nr:glycosyltransferase family 4 protein [Candidatus Tectomicrobia bacterium]